MKETEKDAAAAAASASASAASSPGRNMKLERLTSRPTDQACISALPCPPARPPATLPLRWTLLVMEQRSGEVGSRRWRPDGREFAFGKLNVYINAELGATFLWSRIIIDSHRTKSEGTISHSSSISLGDVASHHKLRKFENGVIDGARRESSSLQFLLFIFSLPFCILTFCKHVTSCRADGIYLPLFVSARFALSSRKRSAQTILICIMSVSFSFALMMASIINLFRFLLFFSSSMRLPLLKFGIQYVLLLLASRCYPILFAQTKLEHKSFFFIIIFLLLKLN